MTLPSIDWSVVGTVVTALATIVLAVVTTVLARETKRLSDATSQPNVVVTLEPSPWSIIHTNLVFQNTGTGAAYDIEVKFDPPLILGPRKGSTEMPVRSLSVLKPNSSFSVFLQGFEKLNEQVVTVEVSWLRSPRLKKREGHTYILNLLKDYENWGQLGGAPPEIQIAREIKKIREDVGRVVSGFRRLEVDVYDRADRTQERDDLD
jgi:hypothetical protein